MENMKAKMKKQSGFTLIEMLIVVAIIAILVAVSIPAVNTSLEKARDATDLANERSAKSITLLHFMGATDGKIEGYAAAHYDDEYKPGMAIIIDEYNANIKPIYYDAERGILTLTKPVGYGQCTGCTNNKGIPHTDCVIQVAVDEDGIFDCEWVVGADPNAEPDDPWEGL